MQWNAPSVMKAALLSWCAIRSVIVITSSPVYKNPPYPSSSMQYGKFLLLGNTPFSAD